MFKNSKKCELICKLPNQIIKITDMCALGTSVVMIGVDSDNKSFPFVWDKENGLRQIEVKESV